MFFESDFLNIDLLDVVEIDQRHINIFTPKRSFYALSFRYNADSVIKTDSSELHLKSDYVCFFPNNLDYTRTAKTDKLIAIHFDIQKVRYQDLEYFVAKNSKTLSLLFKNILSVWNAKEVGYYYKCLSIFYEILAECYLQNHPQIIRNSKIQKSVDYILENYKKSNLSINEIASHSFMSQVYFRKLFKKEFGVSPQKYIINLRIQNAVKLMLSGYYTIKEIAYNSGYTDYKYFSAEFKRIKGVSPSSFMQNLYK